MFDIPLRSRTEETELNLSAITSIFHEAQRVEVNGYEHSKLKSFWALEPPVLQKSKWLYERGFGAYRHSDEEVGEPSLTYKIDKKGKTWMFERSPFPEVLVRATGKRELVPLFYESLHTLTNPNSITKARVFAVYGDESMEIANLEGKAEGLNISLNDDAAFYNILPGNNFNYKLRKVSFSQNRERILQ